ncbi:X protein [Crowned shrew hepatitis B virus]|uniref:Protein X n=1 Tax=Crowned shrew hepatitis B virus TaxID=2596879 RepID=A0A516RTP7_9HEPA|nr:X protein [Crowned shrew hepatitis B virus]
MAARMLYDLDPATGTLRLRAIQSQPGGLSFSPVGPSPRTAPSPSSLSGPGSHRSLRGLPSCFASSAGPCVLRFTFGELGQLDQPRNAVLSIQARSRGTELRASQQRNWTWYMLCNPNVNNLGHDWLMYYGGCRHK